MANGFDGNRQFPYPILTEGKGYKKALQSRSQAILNTLMGLLASNYTATIPSTEYSYYLRSIALELARLTLALEELSTDISFEMVRSEFLHEVIGIFVFVDGEMPQLDEDMDDEEWREFLLKIIQIFFQGSTPKSIEDAVRLFTDQEFTVKELSQESRNSNSPVDISSQFEFVLEFEDDNFPEELFRLQNNLKIMVDIIKPAHTLYGIRHIFTDIFDPDKLEDEMSFVYRDYRYEDIRKDCKGMAGFSSETGKIEIGDLHVLQDTSSNKPLYSVGKGSSLHVLSGPNRGIYRVQDISGTNGVRVEKRFLEPETGVEYVVEVGRLGAKKEQKVEEEDASAQFIGVDPLELEITAPSSVLEATPFTVEAAALNTSQDIIWTWSVLGLSSSNSDSATYEASIGTSELWIRVEAESADGRRGASKIKVIVTSS